MNFNFQDENNPYDVNLKQTKKKCMRLLHQKSNSKILYKDNIKLLKRNNFVNNNSLKHYKNDNNKINNKTIITKNNSISKIYKRNKKINYNEIKKNKSQLKEIKNNNLNDSKNINKDEPFAFTFGKIDKNEYDVNENNKKINSKKINKYPKPFILNNTNFFLRSSQNISKDKENKNVKKIIENSKFKAIKTKNNLINNNYPSTINNEEKFNIKKINKEISKTFENSALLLNKTHTIFKHNKIIVYINEKDIINKKLQNKKLKNKDYITKNNKLLRNSSSTPKLFVTHPSFKNLFAQII